MSAHRTVPLTMGYVALVDAADYALVITKKWRVLLPRKGSPYAKYATSTIRDSEGKERSICMHRFILGLTDPRVMADHRNGDGLDNRRENLRVADNRANQGNSKMRSDNTSGYRGIVRQKDRWLANIKVYRQRVYLGCFKTAEEAARAYDAKALEVFGEFATLNFRAGLSEAAPEKEKL